VHPDEIKRELSGQLLLFGKTLRPKTHWAPVTPIHKKVEQMLLHGSNKNNIILPRGMAKSVIVGEEYPLYHTFMEDIGQPKLTVIVSKTQSHSINRLSAIKDTISYSYAFKAIFGHWGEYTAKSWRLDEIILKDGSVIIAKGMGQPIRGLNFPGGIRPTLIVLDDPEDENNTKTSEAMENNLLWFLKGAMYALDTRFGKAAVIGTPLHQKCLVKTLEEMEGWDTLTAKFLNEDAAGNLYSLWPEVKSVEALLEEKKEADSIGRLSIFYAERQCEVIGDEDQLFRPEDIKYYEGNWERKGEESYLIVISLNEKELKEPMKLKVFIFIGVDPASSVKQRADFSTIVPIAVDYKRRIFVLPYFRKRVKPMELGQNVINYAIKYKPNKMRIESVGYQEMLREYVKKEMAKRKIHIPGLEIKENPRNKKSARLETMQPLFAQGKVYILKNMTELEDELLLYPRGSHDDLLDGIFYAQKKHYAPYENDITDTTGYREDIPIVEPGGWLTA